MDEDDPTCSTFTKTSGDGPQELQFLDELGITVWGKDQQVLEQQALQEINIFQSGLEEGEIEEVKETKTDGASMIENLIKRQEQLKKRQDLRKTLQVPDKNREIANQVSRNLKRKKERKSVVVEKRVKVDKNEGQGQGQGHNQDQGQEQDPDRSGSEYVPSEDEDYEERSNSKRGSAVKKLCANTRKVKDDGCVEFYKARLEEYHKKLEQGEENDSDYDEEAPEFYTVKGGLKIPLKIWKNLYSYQQDGVRWLWEIHQKTTGGLLGDEMGLGKTVQIIAFLSGLEYSQTMSCHSRFKGVGPSIIVCPATVIHQWVKHFHEWAPQFRVAILHTSGSFQGNRLHLIREMHRSKGIIVTTYHGILKYKGQLLEHQWHYLILDEGHKIRNHSAKVSKAVKELRTPHRLMLTGSPMQNNLQELWSLFDFTNPGMLGNLTTFMEHFNNPIVQGGFANATDLQEATALNVATTLKNIITPFLLRRSKAEVQMDISLPTKNEQVLFCSLTNQQRDLYKGYLMGDHMGVILNKNSYISDNHARANMLVAITTLRKICNHPDIYLNDANEEREGEENLPEEEKFGYYKKSGKMIVVSALLKIWKKQKHRVLLFSQGLAMITIFEHFLTQQGYTYLKMDGSTAVSSRQPLIDKFNRDASYDVFLLTTRVGGLGINLTGADRVIIYDPDWNPATDTQARERAWRIGQDKQVTIYRLLSAGTIEEKMYQRQVWKQLLSNKVLLDPKTNKFFKNSNLYDLFSLSNDDGIESENIFRDSRVQIEERMKEAKLKKKRKNKTEDASNKSVEFSEEKVQAMKNLAQQIAKSLSAKPKTTLQIELEEERQQKLEERQKMKALSAMEIVALNREKAKSKEEEPINKVDDCETAVSFDKALEFTEETSKLYREVKAEKIKNYHKYDRIEAKKRDCSLGISKSVVDVSGKVDGEKIEGLVKTEVKKANKQCRSSEECQDQYVLEKLFAKKGVSGALQHDAVVDGGVRTKSLRVETEARSRADKALEALKKSRVDKWRW